VLETDVDDVDVLIEDEKEEARGRPKDGVGQLEFI
jgi:hypothetical protein